MADISNEGTGPGRVRHNVNVWRSDNDREGFPCDRAANGRVVMSDKRPMGSTHTSKLVFSK